MKVILIIKISSTFIARSVIECSEFKAKIKL